MFKLPSIGTWQLQLIAAVVIAAASAGGTWWITSTVKDGASAKAIAALKEQYLDDQKKLVADRAQALDERDKKEAEVHAAAQNFADQLTQQKKQFQTLMEKVNENIDSNPGYADCSLDPDGLRLWNQAHTGAGNPDVRDAGRAGDAAVPEGTAQGEVGPAGRPGDQ